MFFKYMHKHLSFNYLNLPDNGPINWAMTRIPNPKDAATIIKLGLGRFNVTIAHPQQQVTKNIIAIHSATPVRYK